MSEPGDMRSLHDSIVIYFSEQDDAWIAHSLHTDQMAYGDRIVDALADLMRAIDQVFRLARPQRS